MSLVKSIVEGIHDKKGHRIRVADLTGIGDTICNYLVICEGNTPTQVAAICDSVEDYVRIHEGVKPIKTAGQNNCIWVAMDYADVMVHIFVPDAREFYDLDNLWDDADVTDIPDLD
jgi:ribosome-associated protein